MDEVDVVNQTAMYLGDKLFTAIIYVGMGSAAIGLIFSLFTKNKPPESEGQNTK